MLLLKHIDPNGSSSYNNFIWYPMETNKLSHLTKCCCSHDILNEFQAEHITTHDKIILGSSCIELFNADYKKLTKRALALRKNPDAKYCPSCDRKVRKTTVEQFTNQNNIYHNKCWKLEQDFLYQNMEIDCEWCDEKIKQKDLKNHYIIHEALIEQHEAGEIVIRFGKHINKKLKYILDHDIGYLRWLGRVYKGNEGLKRALLILIKK
jgi:hypothetical protein